MRGSVTQRLLPFALDSVTSREAARLAEGNASRQAEKIIAILRMWPHGRTREEIAEVSCMCPDTVRPRVKALLLAGIIEATGEVRLTRSGRPAEIVRLKGAAK